MYRASLRCASSQELSASMSASCSLAALFSSRSLLQMPLTRSPGGPPLPTKVWQGMRFWPRACAAGPGPLPQLLSEVSGWTGVACLPPMC